MALIGEWFGGRESTQVWEDEWAPCRSWSFHRTAFPEEHECKEDSWVCPLCRSSLRIYLHLLVAGTPKGRLRPVEARAFLSLNYEGRAYARSSLNLGTQSVTSLVAAKAWADGLLIEGLIPRYLREYYYARDRVKLLERFSEELGWHEWFCSFEDHPDYAGLGRYADYSNLRGSDSQGSMWLISLIGYGGYSSVHLPTRWDRIQRSSL